MKSGIKNPAAAAFFEQIASYTRTSEFESLVNEFQTGYIEIVGNAMVPTTKKLLEKELPAVRPAHLRGTVTFQDIPCFVFAFAGFKNSDHANAVNEACDKFGIEVRAGQHTTVNKKMTIENNRMAQLRTKLASECADLQIYMESTENGPRPVDVTIYGKFTQAPFGIPDHAWIVCRDHIFETWPTMEMRTEPATTKSVERPASLRLAGIARKLYTVGRFDTFLTVAQAIDIARAFPTKNLFAAEVPPAPSSSSSSSSSSSLSSLSSLSSHR